MRSKIKTSFITAINRIAFVALLLLIAVPAYMIVSVKQVEVDAEAIAASRSLPTDRAIEQLKNIDSLGFPASSLTTQELVAAADAISNGIYKIGNLPPVRLGLSPKWGVNPYKDPTWVLELQSLAPVNTLLQAYDRTHQPKYLLTAKDLIMSWIRWSVSSVVGSDYTWNDHAISERTGVFGKFWLLYRNCPYYDAEVARNLLNAVSRHAAFLKDPRLFTFQSNHGFMQNIALLQIAALFPAIAKKDDLVSFACHRLDQQFLVLVSSGLMLEHSPGYHGFAVKVVQTAINYLRVLGHQIPSGWQEIATTMEEKDNLLRRPDGSYPPIGDTEISARSRTIAKSLMEDSRALLPFEGVSIFWRNHNQLVTTWQNFPSHAHKHADEMSVYLYGDGVTWLGGPGYCPYGDTVGRALTTGWWGSNAPYFQGEPAIAIRQTTCLGEGSCLKDDFLELRREGPGHFAARREILWIDGSILVVLDVVYGGDEKAVVSKWHTSPGVEAVSNGENSWLLHHIASGKSASICVAGGSRYKAVFQSGMTVPFEGWAFADGRAVPAQTLVISGPGGHTTTATAVITGTGGNPTPIRLTLGAGASDEQWKAKLQYGPNSYDIHRYGKRIDVLRSRSGEISRSRIEIVPPPDVSKQRKLQDEHWTQLSATYGAGRLYVTKNSMNTNKVKLLFATIGIVFVCQEVVLMLASKYRQHLATVMLRVVSTLAVLFVAAVYLFKLCKAA
jgi:hypothetical protein